MANSSYLELEDIIVAIAHEVKNPLTLVKANLDILESIDDKLENKKNYNMIRLQIDKINDIMTNFIQLTRSNLCDNIDVIYIADVISTIVNGTSISYDGRIKIFLNISNYDLCVLGNEKNINMMFNNIMKNAVEAIDDIKEGVIIIDVFEENENVIVKFKDNGVGISEDIQEKIFEKFFTTKKFGSGLGIPICQKIAKEHKGFFMIKNNELLGCTAIVSLPKYN